MRFWDNNGCRGGPGSAVTAGVWPSDEGRPYHHQQNPPLPTIQWHDGRRGRSVLTMIPLGHHSASSFSPDSRLTPFIQQSLTSTTFKGLSVSGGLAQLSNPHLRCLAKFPNLSPSFKMNKQKQWERLSRDLILAICNFLYLKGLKTL